MVGIVRHCQPKGTETDMPNLQPLRQGSTLRCFRGKQEIDPIQYFQMKSSFHNSVGIADHCYIRIYQEVMTAMRRTLCTVGILAFQRMLFDISCQKAFLLFIILSILFKSSSV